MESKPAANSRYPVSYCCFLRRRARAKSRSVHASWNLYSDLPPQALNHFVFNALPFMRYLPFGMFILYGAILILLAGINDRFIDHQSAASAEPDRTRIVALK